MSIEEYEAYRDTLIKWGWLAEALDANRNKFTYHPTELGVAMYSAIVNIVGRDRLVNGYKLDVKKMEGIEVSGSNVQQKVLDELLQYGILVETYDPSTDVKKYELTPTGSRLFVAFFVSNKREVGTLPGDATAKFFEIMHNMPKYVNTASALINQLGNAFQSFDKNSNYRGGGPRTGDFDAYTPNYGGAVYGSKPTYKKKVKRKTKKKKSTKRKRSN